MMMTLKERMKRVRKFLAKEASQPLAWWWLSFTDPDQPEEQQFLGACLVKATGMFGAVRVSYELGINPGGQVEMIGPLDANVEDGWADRLLTKAECDDFDRTHAGLTN
jgi:hypothetical protein